MKPKIKTYKVTREQIDSIEIPDYSNIVIVHVSHKNSDTKTDSGIIVVGDQDYKPSDHSERWGYVFKANKNLYYNKRDVSSVPWKTTCEVEEGDKVWFDFRQALYAYTLECDGEWYKILDYEFLHVVKKGDGRVVPLNGNILFKEFKPERTSEFLIDTDVDKKYGVACYVGEKNQEYTHPIWTDGIDIRDGDHVLFEDGTNYFPLESGLHNEFSDDRFVLQQRRKVVAVVDDNHENIIRLHEMALVVEVIPEKLDRGLILLNKPQRSYRIAKVVDTACEIPVGSLVVIAKQKGIHFHGKEIIMKDVVFLYETM